MTSMVGSHIFRSTAILHSFDWVDSTGRDFWERGGSVVERRTPEQEVAGSKSTSAALCTSNT